MLQNNIILRVLITKNCGINFIEPLIDSGNIKLKGFAQLTRILNILKILGFGSVNDKKFLKSLSKIGLL